MTPLCESDLEAFLDCNRDPTVRHFLWDDRQIAREEAADIIARSEKSFQAEQWGLWSIATDDSPFLGYCGLWCFFEEAQPQLLYALSPQFTGRGFATRTAQAVVDYSRRSLGYTELVASVDEGNIASVRVCERLGFTYSHRSVMGDMPTHFYRLDLTP